MSDLRIKIKRQIEILALVMAEPRKYIVPDLQFVFDCNEITIKRDLSELRSRGINIHSIPKKGLISEGNIPDKLLAELLNEYILLSNLESTQKLASASLVDIKKENSLLFIVIIQRAIERARCLSVVYKKSKYSESENKIIDPIFLFEREGYLRLIANENGKRKQFVLEKFISVKELDKTFPKPDISKLMKAFDESFGAWIAEGTIPIKLKFSKKWLSSGKIPHLMKEQQIEEQNDGSLIVSFTISYLEDLARWVVARGGEVIALEPNELRNKVIELSKQVFQKHLIP